ncbi:MAG: hypothetical protein PHY92_01515 [Alphaproteobacteria bacterium]|nr:hypothetical protein [Alphaproteobacteria bacterium]
MTGGSAIRAVGSLLGIFGRQAAGSAIDDAAKAIEEYFGGKPERTFRNEDGDIVIMGGDKKIHFDVNNPGRRSEPHFHIQEKAPGPRGRWQDVGQHQYPFRKE